MSGVPSGQDSNERCEARADRLRPDQPPAYEGDAGSAGGGRRGTGGRERAEYRDAHRGVPGVAATRRRTTTTARCCKSDLDGVIIITPHGIALSAHQGVVGGGQACPEREAVRDRPGAGARTDRPREGAGTHPDALVPEHAPLAISLRPAADRRLATSANSSSIRGRSRSNGARSVAGGSRRRWARAGCLVDTGSHFVDLMLYLTGYAPGDRRGDERSWTASRSTSSMAR